MLINSEDKKNFILDFLKSMKKHPDFTIFAHFNPLSYGFFDLDYIAKTPIISLDRVQEYLKSNKKIAFREFMEVIRNVFIGISDYLFEDDPVQINCEMALAQVKNLQINFINKFYNNSKKVLMKRDFREQLEMVYYLRKHQNNEGLMKQIGGACDLMQQNEEEIIFDLGKSQIWEQILKYDRQT